MNKDLTTHLYSKGYFQDIDIHFSRLIGRLDSADNGMAALAAALVSRATTNGDVCLDLSAVAGTPVSLNDESAPETAFPDLAHWLKALRRCPAVGSPGQFRPLILDYRNRLYLYRYWAYETDIAAVIKTKTRQNGHECDMDRLKESIRREFPESNKKEKNGVDWQRVAVFVAAMKSFCIISGGPGTGKTTTVSRILAVLLEQPALSPLRIILSAPTGKAAARLKEAIIFAKKQLNCSEAVKDRIPDEAVTLHRMLKPVPGTPYFRYNEKDKLPADVVVVDEASMVDVALLAKLVRALPGRSRLILVGDKDQLSSVEAGAVLGDICGGLQQQRYSRSFIRTLYHIAGDAIPSSFETDEDKPGLNDHIVLLKKSYRFGPESRISEFSRAVNEGRYQLALSIAGEEKEETIRWQEISPGASPPGALAETIVAGFRPYLTAQDPGRALEYFYRFIVLCAVRSGPSGVYGLNLAAEKALADAGLISVRRSYASEWYHGRPVMITKNDYRLGLFNGDIGITFEGFNSDGDHGLWVYFPSETREPRAFFPARLPEYTTVYAMTVHKSQGSEFDHVLLVLPEKDVPVLTRELVYTGITRARKRVTIRGREEIFRSGIARRITRTSGLRDALWKC